MARHQPHGFSRLLDAGVTLSCESAKHSGDLYAQLVEPLPKFFRTSLGAMALTGRVQMDGGDS
jgi:hypothetical protein